MIANGFNRRKFQELERISRTPGGDSEGLTKRYYARQRAHGPYWKVVQSTAGGSDTNKTSSHPKFQEQQEWTNRVSDFTQSWDLNDDRSLMQVIRDDEAQSAAEHLPPQQRMEKATAKRKSPAMAGSDDENDWENVDRFMLLMKAELMHRNIGHFDYSRPPDSEFTGIHSHFLGGTRAGDSPTDSVVDSNFEASLIFKS